MIRLRHYSPTLIVAALLVFDGFLILSNPDLGGPFLLLKWIVEATLRLVLTALPCAATQCSGGPFAGPAPWGVGPTPEGLLNSMAPPSVTPLGWLVASPILLSLTLMLNFLALGLRRRSQSDE